MSNKKFVFANWKMFGNSEFMTEFCTKIRSSDISNNLNVVICPSFLHLDHIINNLSDLNHISIGAQNVSHFTSTAATGEISADMLSNIGVDYVIIGHSERRAFCDNNNIIIQKTINAIDANIKVVLCIGDSEDILKKGETLNFLKQQIDIVLSSVTQKEKSIDNIIIAYEPIWAIGTGIVPELETISETISTLKEYILLKYNKNLHFVYGGSVTVSNCHNILKLTPIDGVLIGGMSLKIDDFLNSISSY